MAAASAARTCCSIAFRAARTSSAESVPRTRNSGDSRSPAAAADTAVMVLSAF